MSKSNSDTLNAFLSVEDKETINLSQTEIISSDRRGVFNAERTSV